MQIEFTYIDMQAKSHENYLPLTLEYEPNIENCEIYINAKLEKTKDPNVLVLTFTTSNFEWIEIEKLYLMISLKIEQMESIFSYELVQKAA